MVNRIDPKRIAEIALKEIKDGKEFVKFTLPIGAHIGGFRYLGNGEFLGQLPPLVVDKPPELNRLGMPPMVFQSTVSQEDAHLVGDFMALEICENPTAADFVYRVTQSQLVLAIPDESGETVLRVFSDGLSSGEVFTPYAET